MTHSFQTPENKTANKSFWVTRPFRIAVICLFILVTGTTMLYWARGAGEHKIVAKADGKLPPGSIDTPVNTSKGTDKNIAAIIARPSVDTNLFNRYMSHITNGDSSGRWPVKSAYPIEGAIFPFKRVLAFYGNLYSKKMGILGALPPDEMTMKLQEEVERWQAADTTLVVVPALHYIAATAQMAPGKGNKYRLRMPFKQIDSVLAIAKKIDALVFLDIQVGWSTLEEEIPALEKYLIMPNVHLGIDPEFSMKTGKVPGKIVGSFDAADINYASDFLAGLVASHNLPPKILVVHRFTQGMVTNYKQIETKPEVQLVIDMDGWGERARKINTFKQYIYKEPVEFTGFKLFYKNDTKGKGVLLTPPEVLKLRPQPVYIQYQ